MATKPRSAVIGIGNVLLGDDALGPYVVALVAAGWRLPDDVTLLDAGTPGIDLADYMAGRRIVVLVDSVKPRDDSPPGTIRVYRKSDLLGHGVNTVRAGGHDPALRDTLLSLELAGQAPEEVLLVGVVPESTRTGTGMTSPVRYAAQRAAEEVVRQLQSLGFKVADRVPRKVPDIWWERMPPEMFG